MKLVVAKVTAFFDRTIEIVAIIAGAFVVYLMLSVSAEVMARNLLNRTLPFTIDISEILLLFITFLVAARVQKINGHVRMDFVLTRCNPKQRALINTITYILSAIICLVLTWYGTMVTLDFLQRGIYTQTLLVVPKAPIIAVIPLGFFLLFVQLLRATHGQLGNWRSLQRSGQVNVPEKKETGDTNKTFDA